MAINLGEATYYAGLDWSQLKSGLDQADGHFQTWANRAAGSVQRVGEVAMGVLVAQAIPRIISGFQQMASQAVSVTANLQAMEIGMEGLLAREISKGTEVIKSRQMRVDLTAKEREKLQDLNLQRDKLNAKLQEETERHRQLVARWGEEGLAVKSHAADMAILKEKIDDTSGAIGALERKQGSLATVTEKVRVGTMALGDAMPQAEVKAKKLMDELARIAILSPYQLEMINSTFKQAMAFGYTSGEAVKFTKAMLNVAAGVGATNDMLGRMSYNFAQIRMVGKVTALDIRQLAMAGFDLVSVLQYAGEKYKVAIRDHEDFNAAIASGKITWEQFTEAFAEYADKNFGGAAERMSRTLNGLQSTFKDLFALTMPAVVGPALEAVTGRLSKMLDLFLGIRESGVLESFGQKLGAAAERALAPLDRLLGYIEGIKKSSGSMVGLGALQAGVKPDVVGGALTAAFGPGVAGPLQALRDAGDMLAGAFNAVKTAVEGAGRALKPALDFITANLSNFIKFKDVVAALGIILAVAVVPALVTAAGTLLSFAAPIAAVIAAVALLRTAWERNWGGIQEKVGAAKDAIALFVGVVTRDFRALTDPQFQQNIDAIFGAGATGKIVDFGQRVSAAVNAVKTGWGELTTAFQTGGLPAVGQKLGEWWGQLQAYLATNVPLWGEQLRAQIAALWGRLVTWWDTDGAPLAGQVGQKLAGWWSGVVTWVQTNAPLWGEQLQTIMAGVWAKLTTFDTGNATGQTGFGAFVAQAQGFIASLQPIMQQIGEFFAPTIERIKEAFGGLGAQFETLKPQLAALWESFRPIAELLGKALAGALAILVKLLGELVASLAAHLLPAVGGAAQALTGFFDIIQNKGSLVEGLGKIIGGLLTILGNFVGVVWDALVNTINDIFDTSIPTWEEFKSEVERIVENLVTGVKTKVENIKTAIVTKWEEILDYIRALPEKVLKHGEEIIDGLFQGITNAWGRMIEKFKNLVALLPDVVKKILGIASPSKVFAAIGEQSMAGLALGFEAGAGAATGALLASLEEVINALAAWANAQNALNGSKNILSAKAVTEPLAAIVNNVAQIGQGLREIALLRVPANVADRIRAMTALLPAVLGALADFAAAQDKLNKSTHILSAKAVAEPLANIAGNLQRIIGAFADLGAARLNAGALTAALPVLMDLTRAMIQGLAGVARNVSMEDATAAATAAGVLGALVAPFQGAAQTMGALFDLWQTLGADWLTRTAGSMTGSAEDTPWQRMLNVLKDLLRATKQGVAQILANYGDIPEELNLFAAQLTGLLEPFRAAADAFGALFELWDVLPASWLTRTAGSMTGKSADTPWQQMLNVIKDFLRAMKQGVEQLRQKYGDIAPELADFAAKLAGIVAPFTQALAFLKGLADWRETRGLTAKFDAFSAAWADILNGLATLRVRTAIVMSDDLVKFTKAVGEIGNALQGAVKFLADLSAWQQGADLRGKMDKLVAALDALLDKLKPVAAKWSTEGLKKVTDLANAIKLVMDGLKSALELALKLPATWTAPAAGVWDAFFGWTMGVFEAFVAQVIRWTERQAAVYHGGKPGAPILTGDRLNVVAAVAGAFGNVMTALKSALDLALALPATWAAPAPTVWDPFFAWATGVFEAFVARVQAWTQTQTTTYDALGNATTTTGTSWLATGDNIGVVGAVAGAFGAVFGGLQSALQLAMADWGKLKLPDLETTMKDFVDWVGGVFDKVGAYIQAKFPGATADTFAPVSAFGSAMSAVMGGLASALELLKGLIWFVKPAEERVDNFLAAVKQVIDKVATGAAGVLTDAQNKATQAFAATLSALFGAMQSAISLFDALGDFNADTSPQGKFAHRIETFNEALSLALTSWRNWIVDDLDADAAAVVAAFAPVIQSIAAGFQSGLNLIGALNEQGVPTTERLDAFLKLILKLFGDFTTQLKAVVDADDWVVLGKDMLGGLTAGVNAEKPNLLAAARAASYDAYLEVKKALGIASPSKVMAGLGVQIPAGLVAGIEQGQQKLERALGGMFATAGVAPDVQIDARKEAHIYLHADDLNGLNPAAQQDMVRALAEYLRLGGLRVAVA